VVPRLHLAFLARSYNHAAPRPRQAWGFFFGFFAATLNTRVSKMAHYDIISTQRFSRQQDWSIDRWCRGLRISRRSVETHPHIRDVATLLMFDQHQTWMSDRDRNIWTHCWQWTYHRQLPLSQYHRRQLTHIIDHIQLRQCRLKHIQQRQTRRESEIGKRSHDNDDKGLRSLGLVATDPEQ